MQPECDGVIKACADLRGNKRLTFEVRVEGCGGKGNSPFFGKAPDDATSSHGGHWSASKFAYQCLSKLYPASLISKSNP